MLEQKELANLWYLQDLVSEILDQDHLLNVMAMEDAIISLLHFHTG